jgi:hypothetical protein
VGSGHLHNDNIDPDCRHQGRVGSRDKPYPRRDQSRAQHLCQCRFHELPVGGIYTDGVPANPVLVNGWVRSGHPEDKTSRLATEIAAAVSRIADVPAARVLMVIQNSPARFAVEGGRVLPEPGQEQAWLAAE